MDSLDLNTHRALLLALASNCAQSSSSISGALSKKVTVNGTDDEHIARAATGDSPVLARQNNEKQTNGVYQPVSNTEAAQAREQKAARGGVLGSLATFLLGPIVDSTLSTSSSGVVSARLSPQALDRQIAYAHYVTVLSNAKHDRAAAQTSSIQEGTHLNGKPYSINDDASGAEQASMEERIIKMADALPDLVLDRYTPLPLPAGSTIAIAGGNSGPIPIDELAYALVEALLSLSSAAAAKGDRYVSAVLQLGQKLQARLVQDDATRLACHTMPAYNGFRRAIATTPHTFSLSSLDLLTPFTLDKLEDIDHTLKRADSTQTSSFAISLPRFGTSTANQAAQSEDKVWAQIVLDRYETAGRPLSVTMLQLASLQVSAAIVGPALLPSAASAEGPDGMKAGLRATMPADQYVWTTLLENPISVRATADGSARSSIHTAFKLAIDSYAQSLELLSVGLDDGDDEVQPDAYAVDIIVQALKLATLADLASNENAPHDQLLAVVKKLTSEDAPFYDARIQAIALDALVILMRNYAGLSTKLTTHIRRYVTSPIALFEADAGALAPTSLTDAAKTLSIALDLANSKDLVMSTVYSLLNYFPGGNTNSLAPPGSSRPSSRMGDAQSVRSTGTTRGRSDLERETVSISTLYAVTYLAHHFKDREITRLSVSLMLQKLTGTGSDKVQAAILYNLADLGPLAEKTEFIDIIKRFSEISQSSKDVDSSIMSSSVLTAQMQLARGLASDDAKAKLLLSETLSLFIAKGLVAQQAVVRSGGEVPHYTNQLMALLPVLEAVVGLPSFDHEETDDAELTSKFRNMWYLCILFGFLSPSSRIQVWQKLSLHRIAAKTPCLARHAGSKFIEEELEYNVILRKDFPLGYFEAQRSELGAAIPQHAGQIRTLSLPQTIFLITVLRLEMLRANTTHSATMLQYFSNDGINSSPISGCLASIADKVNETYRGALNDQVSRHSVKPEAFNELRKMIKACCSPQAPARKVALRYVDNVIGSFPSLLCDLTTVTTLLELLTLLRHACEAQYENTYRPRYSYHSRRADLTLELPDNYAIREQVLTDYYKHARAWLVTVLARAPIEMQGILQVYVDDSGASGQRGVEMGKSVAIDVARSMPTNARESALPAFGGWKPDSSSAFADIMTARHYFSGHTKLSPHDNVTQIKHRMQDLAAAMHKSRVNKGSGEKSKASIKPADLRTLLYRAAGALIAAEQPDYDILHYIVWIPMHVFSPLALRSGVEVWSWLVDAKPELEVKIMTELTAEWSWTMRRRRGLFSSSMNSINPMLEETQFTPTDKKAMDEHANAARRLLQPHSILLDFLTSRYQAYRYRDAGLVAAARRLVVRSLDAYKQWSSHPLARELRNKFLLFGFMILQGSQMEGSIEYNLRERLYTAALHWFASAPLWTYGADRLQITGDVRALRELLAIVEVDRPASDVIETSFHSIQQIVTLPGNLPAAYGSQRIANRRKLLALLLDNEVTRLAIWLNPLDDKRKSLPGITTAAKSVDDATFRQAVQTAWRTDPAIAVHMAARFKSNAVRNEVRSLVLRYPRQARDVPEALEYVAADKLTTAARPALKHLIFWAASTPVICTRFFLTAYEGEPRLLQYAMRVLEHHPIELIFFYIPQVVQALRTDETGYVERFIFETAKISQLFCHQIIWNMKANCFKDDEGEEPDPMKPTFDRLIESIASSLSGEARDFYEREFEFFNTVTSISKKLQPLIKKSKPEKKAKIDEEIAQIVVDQGVYLPSNPDGVVVDIDRKSGRPLQSAAKAPFMATFKVRRERKRGNEDDMEDGLIEAEEEGGAAGDSADTYDTWQAAIFKVGDDCRQDVMALQVIAMFKNIFSNIGLELHLVPYRVTATAPGCGVIDVVPNATSRDEMGRAKINYLLDYFTQTFGAIESVPFQKARISFIQSLAAYSVLCHIMQIRDRHNGNIMINETGHLVHIDFGFLLTIGPGGMHFEPYSFKLSDEFIDVIGGKKSPEYQLFRELVVKAFLACRPYVNDVVAVAELMYGTGLACYSGKNALPELRDRFKPEMTEQQATKHMIGLIDNAETNVRSVMYDQIQTMQNSIPYNRGKIFGVFRSLLLVRASIESQLISFSLDRSLERDVNIWPQRHTVCALPVCGGQRKDNNSSTVPTRSLQDSGGMSSTNEKATLADKEVYDEKAANVESKPLSVPLPSHPRSGTATPKPRMTSNISSGILSQSMAPGQSNPPLTPAVLASAMRPAQKPRKGRPGGISLPDDNRKVKVEGAPYGVRWHSIVKRIKRPSSVVTGSGQSSNQSSVLDDASTSTSTFTMGRLARRIARGAHSQTTDGSRSETDAGACSEADPDEGDPMQGHPSSTHDGYTDFLVVDSKLPGIAPDGSPYGSDERDSGRPGYAEDLNPSDGGSDRRQSVPGGTAAYTDTSTRRMYFHEHAFWRVWHFWNNFFFLSFADPKSERHRRREEWQLGKGMALFGSCYYLISWALLIGLFPKPSDIVNRVFVWGLIPGLTIWLPFAVIFDAPKRHPLPYQIYLWIVTWLLPLHWLTDMHYCGYYTTHAHCGSKDFTSVFYALLALPTVSLFALCQRRLPHALGVLAMTILMAVFIVPIRRLWIRNVINFVLFHGFLMYISFARERAERHLSRLRMELKTQYIAVQKAQINERKTGDSKRRLTSYLFHEVRVPLNTALLSAQNMGAAGVFSDPTYAELDLEFSALEGSLVMMQKVLNDVLDFQRLDAGRLETVCRPFSFSNILKSILLSCKVAASARGITLETDLDPRIDQFLRTVGRSPGVIGGPGEDFISGDMMRLRQVLTNITSNGIKFTPAGGTVKIVTKLLYPAIELKKPVLKHATSYMSAGAQSASSLNGGTLAREWSRAKSDDIEGNHPDFAKKYMRPRKEHVVLRFEIHDTGCGIRSRDLQDGRLFSAYVQTEQGRAKGGKGTGLGLALVRHIVQLHGGRLGVSSRQGHGSCFWVELPYEVGASVLKSVDKDALENYGYDKVYGNTPPVILEAGGGLKIQGSAIVGDKLTPTTEQRNFDFTTLAVLTTDGSYSTTSSAPTEPLVMPATSRTGAQAPVATSTALPPSDPAAVALSAPLANAPETTLSAPTLDRPAIENRSQSGPARMGLIRAASSAASGSPPLDLPFRKRRVLCTDDDQLTRRLMTRMLTRLGCEVVCAENGRQALEVLLGQPWSAIARRLNRADNFYVDGPASAATQPTDEISDPAYFDVIFMDNQMPLLRGVEMVSYLRLLGRKDLLVGVTANALKSDQDEFLDAGADRVLTKPLMEASLKRMLALSDRDNT
ncbi:uncharacterized protein L969DRAFT_97129 [Mixia osmundae IAM 14324]|uniref:1-phosphatidylinositol 4-kinase n=1 Tax=Mixia osmundae (strain CBS 9802 / IAM 14324 / JCM 22182 / KY 12970) TaxID=764103 RepID=G7E1S2_MIXOS|nr:uncharacterized protein L969DRAFT_97129 [Mixia osmundae IAM 14324]KEI36731.1 hypothetical protein L969DRAFT_97129 [Mixia osmundae IAM 14324]GAA96782.1 hypothetical protein E5Q_03453 [Mixia osmundae IAM 14324]